MITYKFEMEQRRAAAYDAEGTLVGKCTFTVYPEYWSIDHTNVRIANRGQGIAAGLVDLVVQEAKAAGVKVEPICSYAVKLFAEKEAYQQIQK